MYTQPIHNIALDVEEKANVSVFIMAYNEEVNIERCLESVRWSNDIVILDSFSQDRTVELARAYPNLRIFQRDFDDFSSQRNYAIRQIPYRNPWLLVLDADERVEPSLALELQALACHCADVKYDVFLVRRKVFINNRWIRWNTSNDFWIERLIRPQVVHYEGAVHEKVCFEGAYGCLKGRLEHHQFSKGIKDWMARRRRYARLEMNSVPVTVSSVPTTWDLLSPNVLRRRAALKTLFYRLPARWAFYFSYNFLFRFPYLDGLAGLHYIVLESYSQYIAVSCGKRENARTR